MTQDVAAARADLERLAKLADEAMLPMSVKMLRMHKKAVREFRIFANPWKIKALIARVAEQDARMATILEGDRACCVLTRAQCADTIAQVEIGRRQSIARVAALEEGIDQARDLFTTCTDPDQFAGITTFEVYRKMREWCARHPKPDQSSGNPGQLNDDPRANPQDERGRE